MLTAQLLLYVRRDSFRKLFYERNSMLRREDMIDRSKHDVLIIDDDDEVRTALVKVFIKDGYRAVPVASLEEALNLLTQRKFGLLVSNLNLPVEGVIDFLKRIRQIAPSLPVVQVIPLFEDYETFPDGLMLGVFFCTNKPLKREEVLTIASQAIGSVAKFG